MSKLADNTPTETAKSKKGRGSGKRFEAGETGNPAGRPKGTRSSIYAEFDRSAAEAAPEILQALFTRARDGDARAAEIVLRRVWPERKTRTIQFELPDLSGPSGLVGAVNALARGVASGKLTPDEAMSFANLLEINRKLVFAEELDARVRALEGDKK